MGVTQLWQNAEKQLYTLFAVNQFLCLSLQPTCRPVAKPLLDSSTIEQPKEDTLNLFVTDVDKHALGLRVMHLLGTSFGR